MYVNPSTRRGGIWSECQSAVLGLECRNHVDGHAHLVHFFEILDLEVVLLAGRMQRVVRNSRHVLGKYLLKLLGDHASNLTILNAAEKTPIFSVLVLPHSHLQEAVVKLFMVDIFNLLLNALIGRTMDLNDLRRYTGDESVASEPQAHRVVDR
jgi:hypothetical protein